MKKYLLGSLGVFIVIMELYQNMSYSSASNTSYNVGYVIGSLMLYAVGGYLIYKNFLKK